MKALTIWQPYAGLIVAGVKPVENRTWAPPCKPGTRIAIHAGSKRDVESWEHCIDMRAELEATGQWTRGETPWPINFKGAPYSAIIGVATLDEVRREPRGDDPWWVGPVGWYFRDPVAIQPVPCKGAQGLWSLPADADAAVTLAISRALSAAPKQA